VVRRLRDNYFNDQQNWVMKKSILLYLFFVLIAFIGMIFGKSLSGPHLRVWDIENIILLLLGILAIALLPKAGLPAFSLSDASSRKKMLLPLLLGIGFGLLDLLVIEFILPHPPHSSLPPYTQPFPYSLFLYFSGALEIEVFYRLIPITVVMLVFNKYWGGRYFIPAFWVIALLTSLREPLEQWPDGPSWFVAYSLITGIAMNFLQAWYFRKEGFMASLIIRWGHYLIWHILNGIVIQFLIIH